MGGARLTEDVRDAGEGLAVSVRGGFGPDELGEEKCSSARLPVCLGFGPGLHTLTGSLWGTGAYARLFGQAGEYCAGAQPPR